MSLFEQLALGWQCFARTVRESGRSELWWPWARLLVLYVAVLLAIGFAAEPRVSWFMAPLVRWAASDDALRYPELFERLPGLWKWAQLVLDATVAPFAAGVAALLWSERFRGAPLEGAEARALVWRRWFALLLATLPVSLTAVGGHVALGALEQVRLSGLSRALAPKALEATVFLVRVACFFVVPMVMLDPRGPLRALFAAPGRLALAFVPSLVASLLIGACAWPLGALIARPEALVTVAPEMVLVVSAAFAVQRTLLLGLAAGAGTLLYLVALVPQEDDA